MQILYVFIFIDVKCSSKAILPENIGLCVFTILSLLCLTATISLVENCISSQIKEAMKESIKDNLIVLKVFKVHLLIPHRTGRIFIDCARRSLWSMMARLFWQS